MMSNYAPDVTFNRFTIDGVEQTMSGTLTINSGTLTGYDNEDKYVYSFVITPAEPTTVTPEIYELVFDLNKNDGNEGKILMPFSHGGAVSHGNDERFGNVTGGTVDEFTWTSGTTSGVAQIDLEYTGAKLVFSGADFPNSGSATWEAEMIGSSGSNVIDVPTIYNGSFVALNDPLGSWDASSPLHNFQIIKPHVGHNVRLTNVSGTFSSGTFQDNAIDFFGGDSGGVAINIKTYHELPHTWELTFSGSVLQSGTQSFVSDTWLYIEGLQVGGTGYDEQYLLKLYASGTEVAIQYPTPLRTIEINIYIYEGRGRFGVGRFGLARFGLAEDD